jgi:acyl dehydratase
MPLELTVAELADLEEYDLGVGPWTTIDQDRVDRFADAAGDHQWIHVDPHRAAQGPFGTTIAHGYLTLSLVSRLLEDLITITDQVQGINYGLESVRFTAPVPTGSSVRLAATVVGAEWRPDGSVRYRVRLRVDVDGGDRPALVGEALYLAYGP